LLKSGVYRSDWGLHNRFTIYLYSTDTITLSGKYIQQPVLIGNPGYEFRLGQGIINIVPASGLVTAQTAVDINNSIPIITASLVYIRDNYLPLAGGTMRGTLYSNDISASRIKPISSSTSAIQIQNTTGITILNIDTSNSLVGIGTTTPSAKLHIRNSTTTSILSVGGSPTGENGYGIYLAPAFSTSASGNQVAMAVNPTISASVNALYGIESTPTITATDKKLSTITAGVRGYPTFSNTSSASVLYAYGGWFGVSVNGSSVAQVVHGIDVSVTAATSASVLDAYGVYVNSITSGKTSNYAIYTGLGTVRFGDNVQIATGSLTVSSGSLTLSGSIIFTANANISLNSGGNINTDTSTGTKIATDTGQKLGFWNAAPLIQQTYSVSGCSSQVVKTGGSSISTMSEFDGWTVPKVIKTLRNLGILA
jgi:hypothetical protein